MTRKRSQKFEILAHMMLVLVTRSLLVTGAPLQETITDLQSFSDGCYYNYNHYNEADRILTNEPCLNCTCHNKMLMCYLRVCPFSKPIGHDCVVEKREDQCCPTITCPEVPVELSHHVNPSSELNNGLSISDKFGCTINNKFYPEGAQVPSNSKKPCELCYCIKNRTSCIIQECTLHIDGCQPVYPKGACCPVSYNCDRKTEVLELEDLSITTTTIRPTEGFVLTSTINPSISMECEHDRKIYKDGVSIKSNNSCEHCYCMRGDIVCAVQECEMKVVDSTGKSCRAVPPTDEDCCPSNYICEKDRPAIEIGDDMTKTSNFIESKKLLTSTPKFVKSPADLHGLVSPEDVRLQEHINHGNSGKNVTLIPQGLSYNQIEDETGGGDSGFSTNPMRENVLEIATTEGKYSEQLTTEGFTDSMLTDNLKLTTSEPTKENEFISTESNFVPEAMNFELLLSKVEHSTNEEPQYNQTFESYISLKEQSEYSFTNLSSHGINSAAQTSLPPEIQTENEEESDINKLLMVSEDHKTEKIPIGSFNQESFLTTLKTTTSSYDEEIQLKTMSTFSTNLMTASNMPDEKEEDSLEIEKISEITTSSSSLNDLIVTFENINLRKNLEPTTLTSVDGTLVHSTTTDEKRDETSLSSLSISERSRIEISNSTLTPDMFVEFHQSIPAIIPGEGDCLINNITYNNNTQVPTSNVCELSCKCTSSILVCQHVKCELPNNIEHCILQEAASNKCCPSYICDNTENKQEVQLIKLHAIVNYPKDNKPSSEIPNVSPFQPAQNVVTQGHTTTEEPTPYFTKEETQTSYLVLDSETEDYQKETDQPVFNQLGQAVVQTEEYTITPETQVSLFPSKEKEKEFKHVPTTTFYFRTSDLITDDATTTRNPIYIINSSEEDRTTQKYVSVSNENTYQKNRDEIEDDQESTTSLNNVISIEKNLISTLKPLIKPLFENSSRVQVSQNHNQFEMKEHTTTPYIEDENIDYISSYEKALAEIRPISPYNANEESLHHTVVSNFQTISPVPGKVLDFFVSESANSAPEIIPIVSTSITDVFSGLKDGKPKMPFPVDTTTLLNKDEMPNYHPNSSKGNGYIIESLTRAPTIEPQIVNEFTVSNENENRIEGNSNQITSTTTIVPTTQEQSTQTFTEQSLPDTDIISSFEDLSSTKFGLFNEHELLKTKGYNSLQTYKYPQTTADISNDSFSEKDTSHSYITSTEETTSNAFLESDTQNSFPTTVLAEFSLKPTDRLEIGEQLTTDYWSAKESKTKSASQTKTATKIELNSEASASIYPESFSENALKIATESVEENFIPHTFIPPFQNDTIVVTPNMPSKSVNTAPTTEEVTVLFNDLKNDFILRTTVEENISTTNPPEESFNSTIINSNTKDIKDDLFVHTLEGDKQEFNNNEASTITYNEKDSQSVTEVQKVVNSTLITQKDKETTVETVYSDENTSPTKVPAFEISIPKEVLSTEMYTPPQIFLEYFESAQNKNEEITTSTSTEHLSVAQIYSLVTEATVEVYNTHNVVAGSEKETKNSVIVNDDQSFVQRVESEQWLTTTKEKEIPDENTSTDKTESLNEKGFTLAIDSFQKEKAIPSLLFGNDFKDSLKGTSLPDLEETNTYTHMSFVLSTDSPADKSTHNAERLNNNLSTDKDEEEQMSTLVPLLISEIKPPIQVGDSHKMHSNKLLVATSSMNSPVEEGTKNIKNEITDFIENSTNFASFIQPNATDENLDITTKISATTAQIESTSDLRIFENSSPKPQLLPATKDINELTSLLPAHTTTTKPSHHPLPSYDHAPAQYPTYSEDEYTDEDEAELFGPGTCRYGGKLFVSAQQIPRDDPCDFCFCFRSDIICLQQSCPPPIAGCNEEPINGFCCPRYECPVSMANNLNITTSTTTTSTTLPSLFLPHAYRSAIEKNGCHIQGKSYKVGDKIHSASGPCMYCTCGGDGQMKCDPKTCSPEPMLKQMIAVTASRRR